MKALYYGDNLQVLRDSIATESVDLIYLDPPFNSKATSHNGNSLLMALKSYNASRYIYR